VRLSVVLLILVGLLVAACAGHEESGGSTATPAPPPDPGRDAARALVEAVQARDTSALRKLLTERAAARPATVADLLRELRPFEAGYRVIVSERITDRYGVVAIVRQQHAYAVPLRLGGDDWKVDAGGPASIEILGPLPSRPERVAQIGVVVRGLGSGGDGVLYVDGVTLAPRAASDARSFTLFANLEAPLTAGRHVAVAFATSGDRATARAWAFTAR
jgi:hypothetical protein